MSRPFGQEERRDEFALGERGLAGPTGMVSTLTSRTPVRADNPGDGSAAIIAGTLSAAGEPLQRLPPIEARPLTWMEPISFTPSMMPGQALQKAACRTMSIPDVAAPTAKAAVFLGDLPEFCDFLDVDQKWWLDQVSFHLHDDVGAARQYAAAGGRAREQRDGGLDRRRSFVPQSLHVP